MEASYVNKILYCAVKEGQETFLLFLQNFHIHFLEGKSPTLKPEYQHVVSLFLTVGIEVFLNQQP